MLPDLDSLRCFDLAAAHLNFRVAAKAMGLSPAAFGERIRQLESLLGGPVFERTTRSVALNARGHRLLPQARRTLTEAARCLDVANAPGERTPFELVVGTRYELGLSWLVPSLGVLERAHPERRLSLVFGAGPELLRQLSQGQLDVVITSARLTLADVTHEVLHEETYALVAGRRLVKQRPLKKAADAAHHVLLDTTADLPLFRYFLDAAPRTSEWTFARIDRLGTIGAIRQRVLEDAGVAVLPRYLIARDLAARRLVELVPGVRLKSDVFRLVWRTGHAQGDALRELARELRARPLR